MVSVSKHLIYTICALFLLEAFYISCISSDFEHLCSEARSLLGIIKILVMVEVARADLFLCISKSTLI